MSTSRSVSLLVYMSKSKSNYRSIFHKKMETGLIFFILAFITVLCYITFNDMAIKYTKIEESFVGFMNGSPVIFEFQKSPLHTIVYGGIGRQHLFC